MVGQIPTTWSKFPSHSASECHSYRILLEAGTEYYWCFTHNRGTSRIPLEEGQENTPQQESAKRENKTIYEMIAHLCGRQLPAIPVGAPVPSDLTERTNQFYWQHNVLLKFLEWEALFKRVVFRTNFSNSCSLFEGSKVDAWLKWRPSICWILLSSRTFWKCARSRKSSKSRPASERRTEAMLNQWASSRFNSSRLCRAKRGSIVSYSFSR